MSRVNQLPKWLVADKNPAFYDMDSSTAIEMTAKLYGSMRETIDIINDFCYDTETIVKEHKTYTEKDMQAFKIAMEQKFKDFTEVLNTKYSYIDYMLQNVENLIKDINEGKGE